jgi:catechol 2,3-dioxygenase-like lactoylglutathione lyase family enzyme
VLATRQQAELSTGLEDAIAQLARRNKTVLVNVLSKIHGAAEASVLQVKYESDQLERSEGVCRVKRFPKKTLQRTSRTAWRLRLRGGCGHRGRTTPRRPSMTIQRMDNVLIVVDDLDAAISFFVELGMELEGKGPIEGRWVERVIGIDDVRQDIAMLRTPDGHGRIELAMFHTPKAISAEPKDAPANTLGIRRIMFAVDDIEDVVARLRTHGAELVGELAQYEDSYRLCYVRGPEGIIVGLAEQLS